MWKKSVIILGVLGASFSAIFARLSEAPSLVLVSYRMLISALFLSVPGIICARRERDALTGRNLLCCCVSGFFLALHFTAYFTSLRYTGIASSVLLVDTEVFFVAFVMLFFFREKISGRGWIGILVTFAGSAVVALGDAGGGPDMLRGDLLALGGSLCMAVYTVMGKICRREMSTTLYTAVVYWVAAVTTVVLITLQGIPLLGYGRRELLLGLGMAVFCTLLGHSVFSWGLRDVPAPFVSTAKLMEPVFASVLGILFFREMPAVTAIVGGVIVIFGIYYYSVQKE